ncbi:hypothetical protein [Brachybacterium sp. GPGPB12]|uniref:hypothetical protein n=1 Tax=Brachybacterium sp. GPGPB12 TaxID=3023517 RepID=UPI00313442D6
MKPSGSICRRDLRAPRRRNSPAPIPIAAGSRNIMNQAVSITTDRTTPASRAATPIRTTMGPTTKFTRAPAARITVCTRSSLLVEDGGPLTLARCLEISAVIVLARRRGGSAEPADPSMGSTPHGQRRAAYLG